MPTPDDVPKFRLRRYKQCLTPALHKRFNRAVGLIFGICYFEAVLIGNKSSCTSMGNILTRNYADRMSRVLVMVSTRPCWYSNTTSRPSHSFGLCPTRCAATSGEQINQFSISDIQKRDPESEGNPDIRMVRVFGVAFW